jgi:hypothetical protein
MMSIIEPNGVRAARRRAGADALGKSILTSFRENDGHKKTGTKPRPGATRQFQFPNQSKFPIRASSKSNLSSAALRQRLQWHRPARGRQIQPIFLHAVRQHSSSISPMIEKIGKFGFVILRLYSNTLQPYLAGASPPVSPAAMATDLAGGLK